MIIVTVRQASDTARVAQPAVWVWRSATWIAERVHQVCIKIDVRSHVDLVCGGEGRRDSTMRLGVEDPVAVVAVQPSYLLRLRCSVEASLPRIRAASSSVAVRASTRPM
jgi:hypothetical protein